MIFMGCCWPINNFKDSAIQTFCSGQSVVTSIPGHACLDPTCDWALHDMFHMCMYMHVTCTGIDMFCGSPCTKGHLYGITDFL